MGRSASGTMRSRGAGDKGKPTQRVAGSARAGPAARSLGVVFRLPCGRCCSRPWGRSSPPASSAGSSRRRRSSQRSPVRALPFSLVPRRPAETIPRRVRLALVGWVQLPGLAEFGLGEPADPTTIVTSRIGPVGGPAAAPAAHPAAVGRRADPPRLRDASETCSPRDRPRLKRDVHGTSLLCIDRNAGTEQRRRTGTGDSSQFLRFRALRVTPKTRPSNWIPGPGTLAEPRPARAAAAPRPPSRVTTARGGWPCKRGRGDRECEPRLARPTVISPAPGRGGG